MEPRSFVEMFANYPVQNGLALSEKPMAERKLPRLDHNKTRPEKRVGNIQLRAPPPPKADPFGPPPPPYRRPSQDDRRANNERQFPVRKELNIFASPDKTENRRPRRNSDSSVVSAEDRKRRERRQREKEARGKEARPSNLRSGKSERKAALRGLDIIDKLDVTGIYGPSRTFKSTLLEIMNLTSAAEFHHDGPFDACNPHRNRKGLGAAPMQAFPEGSANNSMGGSGPVNKNIDLDRFHGRGAEGFSDYNERVATVDPYSAPYKRQPADQRMAFNTISNVEIVHGQESKGLGTSTFLDGAPAPRAALQSRESEADSFGGGLQRKKSLAQRIRGMSKPRPGGFGDAGRILSPDARYESIPVPGIPGSPGSPNQLSRSAQSGGGLGMMQEINPFFSDDKNRIRITEDDRSRILARSRTTSSPGRGLTRRMTNDGTEESKGLGSGLLSRVKSIRKPRGEKRSP